MDLPFPASQLEPTRPPDSSRTPSPEQITIQVQQLAAQTRAIRGQPYNPARWLDRAEVLDELGYPELAVGDACKAERLAKGLLAFLTDRRGVDWRLGSGGGFWMRDEAEVGRESEDGREGLVDRVQDLIAKARLLVTSNLCSYPECEEGRFVPQEYPWLCEAHRGRGDGLVAEINHQLGKNLVRTTAGKTYCEVKRCSFGPASEGETKSPTALGVFATCNIRKGTKILIDRTELFGCIGQSSSRMKLTGALCGDPLHPNTVDDEGSMDLRWVRDRLEGKAAETLLVCRVLLACVQRGDAHTSPAHAGYVSDHTIH